MPVSRERALSSGALLRGGRHLRRLQRRLRLAVDLPLGRAGSLCATPLSRVRTRRVRRLLGAHRVSARGGDRRAGASL